MTHHVLTHIRPPRSGDGSLFGGLGHYIRKACDGAAWGFGNVFGRHLFAAMGLTLVLVLIACALAVYFIPGLRGALSRLRQRFFTAATRPKSRPEHAQNGRD